MIFTVYSVFSMSLINSILLVIHLNLFSQTKYYQNLKNVIKVSNFSVLDTYQKIKIKNNKNLNNGFILS